jgi:hypothetical protein
MKMGTKLSSALSHIPQKNCRVMVTWLWIIGEKSFSFQSRFVLCVVFPTHLIKVGRLCGTGLWVDLETPSTTFGLVLRHLATHHGGQLAVLIADVWLLFGVSILTGVQAVQVKTCNNYMQSSPCWLWRRFFYWDYYYYLINYSYNGGSLSILPNLSFSHGELIYISIKITQCELMYFCITLEVKF